MSTSKIIPFYGLDRQYKNIRDEILDAADRVYSSGNVLDGPEVAQLETEIATRTNRKYAISVNSCTQALQFSLNALNNETVILPTYSFIATKNVVYIENKAPVFIDVQRNGMLNLDSLDIPSLKESQATLMYVNLYGNIIDYDKLLLITNFFSTKKIAILEDAAQSFGGSYKGIPSGKLGTISCLSFDPTKNLPCYGSGGMVLTDDNEIADFIFSVKRGGSVLNQPGTNSRISESDAAQLLVKLKYFDGWQKRRTEIANYYNEQFKLSNITLPEITPGAIHAWHKYVIHVSQRNILQQTLADNNIETKLHYVYYLNGLCGCSDDITNTCLSLPIHPELTDAEVEFVAKTVKENT